MHWQHVHQWLAWVVAGVLTVVAIPAPASASENEGVAVQRKTTLTFGGLPFSELSRSTGRGYLPAAFVRLTRREPGMQPAQMTAPRGHPLVRNLVIGAACGAGLPSSAGRRLGTSQVPSFSRRGSSPSQRAVPGSVHWFMRHRRKAARHEPSQGAECSGRLGIPQRDPM